MIFSCFSEEGDDSSALEDAAPTSPKGSAGVESTPKEWLKLGRFFEFRRTPVRACKEGLPLRGTVWNLSLH